jgi:hypothetical protein
VSVSVKILHNSLKIKRMYGYLDVTAEGPRQGTALPVFVQVGLDAGFDVTKSEKRWSLTGKIPPMNGPLREFQGKVLMIGATRFSGPPIGNCWL